MIDSYVYYNEQNRVLNLFRRGENYLPAGTIKHVDNGVAEVELWAPIVKNILSNDIEAMRIRIKIQDLIKEVESNYIKYENFHETNGPEDYKENYKEN